MDRWPRCWVNTPARRRRCQEWANGAIRLELAAEAGDDAALGRDFLLTTHVDHNFFGFVLIVE
jgi:hypothetical protein